MRGFFREYKMVIRIIIGVLAMIAGIVLLVLHYPLPGFLVLLVGLVLLLMSTNGYTDKNVVLNKTKGMDRHPLKQKDTAPSENSAQIWNQMAGDGSDR